MKYTLIASILLLAFNISFAQDIAKEAQSHYGLTEENTTTTVETVGGVVLIPGVWELLNYEKSSGQQYLKNEEGVILAVAKNPKKAYPFYKKKQKDYQTVDAFAKWDMDYQIELKRPAKRLLEEKDAAYIIWKFTDENKIDNVFLFGSVDDYILNLLVYTTTWEESKKVSFLQKAHGLNQK